MQIRFETRAPEGQQLRELTEQRARFVLRRLSWLVPRVRVLLSDVNGPRGGVDKRCQVEIKTDAGDSVVISSLAADWRSAVDAALARAARVLTRRWQRTRDRRAPDPMLAT